MHLNLHPRNSHNNNQIDYKKLTQYISENNEHAKFRQNINEKIKILIKEKDQKINSDLL